MLFPKNGFISNLFRVYNEDMKNFITIKKGTFLSLFCLLIIIGLFLIGLWPLNFDPENTVIWLKDENGLRFEGFGMAYCPEPMIAPPRALELDGPITLELCVRSHSEPGNMIARIISFFDGKNREVFIIGQWRSHLIIRIRPSVPIGTRTFLEIGLKNALAKSDKRFLTIISGSEGTSVSVDGAQAKYFPGVSLLSGEDDHTGLLILGNSPDGRSGWRGDLLSFSIYNRLLTAEEVSLHFKNCGRFESPVTTREKEPVVFYGFSEGTGTISLNQGESRYNLSIPKIFHVLQRKTLVTPWETVHLNRYFFKDVAINIVGFIPFGLFFTVWLRNRNLPPSIPAAAIVILLGSGISLAIELLQAYLPARDSSLTDLACNIFGTILGIILSRRTAS